MSRKEEIIELYLNGMKPKDIAERTGMALSSIYWNLKGITKCKEKVCGVCKSKYIAGSNSKWCSKKCAHKAHLMKVFIGYNPSGKQKEYTDEEVAKITKENNEYITYIGGYKNMDDYVYLMCDVCGMTFRHNAQFMRKSKKDRISCKCCSGREWRQKTNTEKKYCVECGKEFTTENRKKVSRYCSEECCNRSRSYRKRIRRDSRIKIKDMNISLGKVFERDKGICYLCGDICDWNDYKKQNGMVICGENYPSIDHVIPIEKGGNHEWQNVKLAHRICNARKGQK